MTTELNRTSRSIKPAAPAVPLSAGIADIIDQMDGPGPMSTEPANSGIADHVEPGRPRPAVASRRSRPASGETRKADLILKKLRSARGATINTLVETSGWQAHSIRGFISGTVKKRMGLTVVSEPGKDGVRRYKIVSNSTLLEVGDAAE